MYVNWTHLHNFFDDWINQNDHDHRVKTCLCKKETLIWEYLNSTYPSFWITLDEIIENHVINYLHFTSIKSFKRKQFDANDCVWRSLLAFYKISKGKKTFLFTHQLFSCVSDNKGKSFELTRITFWVNFIIGKTIRKILD